MFAITAFYHRYFSHKSFRTSRTVQFLFAFLGSSAGQRGPLWWAAHHRHHHGELTLDTAKKEVRVAEQPVELTAYEYKVLEYLMLNPDRVISKTELTDHLYDQDFDRDSNVIEVFVGRLRKKIAPVDNIRTVRGQGYRFVAVPSG